MPSRFVTALKLPGAFIVCGLIHFFAGSIIGAVMATNLTFGGTLGPIHATLNPFGWLTFLIYGMTYAVL